MRLEEEMEKLRGEYDKLRSLHDNAQSELIEAKIEQPVEAVLVPEVSAEIDLSLDGMSLLL